MAHPLHIHIPAPLCPPQIQHDQTLVQTQAAAVGSRRLGVYIKYHCLLRHLFTLLVGFIHLRFVVVA
jgi:hypothetical protein